MPFHFVVKRGATIPDTLQLIVKAVNVYYRSPFVVELTKQLNPTGDKYAFIKRVFDFVCRNVHYKLDNPGDEEVWTPQKTCREGIGDCKKMTVLIASILKCAGIEPVLKHVYYKNELHTHIYVIVPFPTIDKYLTVDPVNHKQWNKEVEHSRASLNFLNGEKMDLHMMGKPPRPHPSQKAFRVKWQNQAHQACTQVDNNIKRLAGIGCGMSGEKEAVLAQALMGDYGITGLDDDEIIMGVAGMGRRSKAQRAAKKAKRKERRKKAFHVFKAVNLAPSRASFLLLVRSNIFHLAERMAKSWIHDPSGLKKVWAQFGGKPEKLKEAIMAGSKRKHKDLADKVRAINGMGRIPSVAELEAMETKGIGFPPAVAAAIAAATPIVLAIIKIIGKSKHDQDTEAPDELAEGIQEGAQAYADQAPDEATEGIGYMDDADQIVSGDDYDYIDGMGKKRKKDKAARKAAKAEKKAARKAKRAAKKAKGGEEAAEAEMEEKEEAYQEAPATKKAKRKLKITNDDVKALSTLAEYGTRKILKGDVSVDDMNQIITKQQLPDDEGTENTPLLPAKATAIDKDISVPKENDLTTPAPASNSPSAAAGSFGLVEINSLDTFLHWFKGASVLCLTGTLIGEIIAIGSFAWLTRSYTFKFTKTISSWLNNGKR